MHQNLDQRLIDILTRQLTDAAEPPPRTTPWLVIAPSYHHFRNYCHEQGLNHRRQPVQAIYITRPEHLRGRDNLKDNIVILGYPRDTRGREMKEYVEALLAVAELRLSESRRENEEEINGALGTPRDYVKKTF